MKPVAGDVACWISINIGGRYAMNEKTGKETINLREQLELKQKALDLIMAIDHVRDTLPEPLAMLSAIANILADQFQADLCMLCLLDRETGELELKAVNDRSRQFGQLESLITRGLAEQAVQAEDVLIWQGDEVLAPAHTLGPCLLYTSPSPRD